MNLRRAFWTSLLFAGLTLLFLSCQHDPCSTLRHRDELMLEEFTDIKKDFENGGFDRAEYLKKLTLLRTREEALFAEARACAPKLTDRQEYNYWFRGRLKFPGSIETELQRMEIQERR